MAIKFTDLPQLSGTPADTDIVAIVDVSEDVSKKITVADLVSATGLDAASVRTIVEGSDLDMGSNKVLFSNMYATEADLPDATSYHGMFAHVHATGAAYFAHGGSWVKLANFADMPSAVDTSAIEADIDALEAKVGSSDLTTPTTASSITYEEVLGAVHTVVSPSSDAITWRSSDNYNSVGSVGRYDGSNTRWQNEFDAARGFYATHDAIFISMEQSSKGVQRIVEYPLNATAIANDQPTAEYHGHTGESQGKYCTAMYADDDVVVATSQQGTGYLKIWTRGADGSNPINVTSPGSSSDWESWGKSVKRVNDYLFVGGYKVLSIHNMDGSFVQQLGPFGGVLPDANANAGGDHQGYGTSAIASYGNTVIIGAPNTDNARGRAMVFDLSDLGVPPTVLSSPEPRDNQAFGGAVDISADYVVVGGAQWYNGSSYDRGRVAVYDSSLNLLKTLAPTGSYLHSATKFGTAVAVRGTALLVGVRGPEPLGNGLRGAILQYDLTDLDAAPTIFVGPDADANFPRSMTTSPDINVTQTVNSTIIPSADVSSAINYLEDKTNDMQTSIAAAASSADIATAKSEAISTAAADATTKADQAEADAKAYADQVVAATIDAAPASLDTLNELAAALNDDANFASTVTASIATKADQTDVDANTASISTLQSSVGGTLLVPSDSVTVSTQQTLGKYYAVSEPNDNSGTTGGQIHVYEQDNPSTKYATFSVPGAVANAGLGSRSEGTLHLSDGNVAFSSSHLFAVAKGSDVNGGHGRIYRWNLGDVNAVPDYLDLPQEGGTYDGRGLVISGNKGYLGGHEENNKIGCIYIFDVNDFDQVTKLQNPEPWAISQYEAIGQTNANAQSDMFGSDFAVNGTKLAVAAHRTDRVFLFDINDHSSYTVLSGFGTAPSYDMLNVSLSDDYLVVGVKQTGKVFVYNLSDGSLRYTFIRPSGRNAYWANTLDVSPAGILVVQQMEHDTMDYYNLDTGSHGTFAHGGDITANAGTSRFGNPCIVSDDMLILGDSGRYEDGIFNDGFIMVWNLDTTGAQINSFGSATILESAVSGVGTKFGESISISNGNIVANIENTFVPSSGVVSAINYLEDKTNSATSAVTSSDVATAKSEAISTASADATAKADQAEADAKAYADQVVAATIDAAPAALDTLNELAAALGDDANFASTVTASIATKADQSALDALETTVSGMDTSSIETDVSALESYIQAAGSAKMVVGVSQENKVLVYNTDGSLSHTIEAPTGALDFGKNIASNGSKIVVSAGGYDISPTSASAVYVFDMDGSNMVKIINSDAHAGDYFGKNDGAIAISDSKIVVGATTHNSLGGSDYADRTGAVYVYNLDGTGEVKILPSDIAKGEEFGNSVAISSSKVIVGSYKHATDGAVYVYNLDGTGELKLNSVAGGSSYAFGLRFGSSVAISETKMVVGSLYSGAAQNGSVHVYDIDGSNRVDIEPPGNLGATFGCDVALNSSKVVIGHKSANRAWIYDLDGSNGIEINTPANADQFGINVSATETKIVVGSKTADTGGVTNNGAAYIYDIDGTNELKVYDPTAGANAFFGEWSTIVEGAASYVTLQTTAQTVGEAINELHTEISNAPAGVTSADVATAKSEAISTAAAYADQVVAATVDAAPAALDTLNELAAALGDDANFASTVTASIATKADDAATTAALATKADQTELDTLETFVKGSGIDFFDHSDSQIANQWINVGGATASGSRLEWDVPNGTSSGSMFGNYVQNLLSATVNDYNSDNAFVIGDSYTLTLDVVSMPTDLKVTVMSAYQTSGASAVWVETTIPAGSTDSVSLEFTATDPGAYVILHGNSALGGVYHVENLAIMGDGEVPLATTATQVVPAINEVVSSVASLTSGTSSDIATAKSEAISTAAADATAKADQAEADAKAYADQVVAATVDAAPASLDTLNELAAALNDDANFASTVTASIATKADASALDAKADQTELDTLDAFVKGSGTSHFNAPDASYWTINTNGSIQVNDDLFGLNPASNSTFGGAITNSVAVRASELLTVGDEYTVSFYGAPAIGITNAVWKIVVHGANLTPSSDIIAEFEFTSAGNHSFTFTSPDDRVYISITTPSGDESNRASWIRNLDITSPSSLDTTATQIVPAINELYAEISSSSSSIQTSSDVDAGDTAADGDVLVYDASSSHFGYVNLEGEVNSRVDAKIATTSVQGLSDVASSGEDTLAGGDFLLYDASTSKFGLVNFESEVQSYANAAANTAVANVVDAAPTSLDTLNELAAALGDDANFASTVTASIATKADDAATTAALATKADDAATTAALATKATQSALDALSASMVSSASPTFTGSVSANNFVEGVSALSGTSASIDPSSGSLITHTLTGGTTYTYVEGWASGASVTLHIESAGNTVTWPSTKWVGGSAPDLSSTAGTHLINLWKVGSEVYGTYVGLAVSGPGAPTLILISAYREDSDTGAVYAFDHTDLSADPVQLQPTGTGAFFGSGVAATSPAHVVIGAWGDGTGGKVYVYDATDLSAAPTVLEPSDIGASDRFGFSVAVSSNFIVVGSQLDDTNEGSNTGSVYVYNANDLSEAPTKLVPFALSASDYFGEKVACSDDYIAVSAPQDDDNGSASGSVFVWPASEMSSGNTIGGSATYTKLTPSDGASSDQFGTAIVISGTTLVVGSFHAASGMAGAGAAYVYDLTNLSTSPTKLMAESAGRTHYARFGGTLAMDGDTLVIGSWGQNVTGSDNTQGAAYVYDASNLGASPTKLIASDGAGGHRFGNTVAVKGNNIVIGASHIAVGATSSAGAAYVYDASDLSAAPVKIDAGTEAAQSAEFGNGIAIL